MPEADWFKIIWAYAEKAGPFATVLMTGMWWLERLERKEERATGNARHSAVMDVLQSIRTFIEVVKDRFPRS